VYVDSGSTDGSPELAKSLGASVVALDMGKPFTAARARNAGFARLQEVLPSVLAIQFIDGDCELASHWIDAAWRHMQSDERIAAVCGRRRERHPETSIYNRLCDIEWDTPVGQARACGGDVLIRVAALRQVGGYRDDLIAGEEPELCVRLRQAGYAVWRIDAEMSLHDAAMTRFGQWWKRTQRGGYAFAEGAALHGAPPERHWVREARRGWVWGLALPVTVLLAMAVASPWCALLLLVYPLQVVRLALRTSDAHGMAWTRATYLVLGKFAEATGQCMYWWRRVRRGSTRLIEYK
jgi:GT2 family glycosyltransferase